MRTLGNVNSLTAKAATGEGTPVNVAAFNHASVQVTGTFSATVAIKASLDGVTWFDIYGHDVGDANHGLEKTVTAPSILQFRELAGIQFLRADVTIYSSGAVTAIINAVA